MAIASSLKHKLPKYVIFIGQLLPCCRLLMYRHIKRVASSIFTKQSCGHSDVRRHGAIITSRLHPPLYRFYSHYQFLNRGHPSFMPYKSKENYRKISGLQNFSTFSSTNTVTRHAQLSWKRVSFPPMSKIVQAISLAMVRSHWVVPGILALVFGELALAQKSSADLDNFSSKNNLYMRAEDGHAYVTSLFVSLLEGLILFLRAIYLSILFSPSIIMAPFADTFGPSYRKMWLRVVHSTLEKAGPAFIKWGQWAATRPDLFPTDLCNELAGLHTKAPEHSFAYTRKTIEKAFGRKISEIFENFEEAPIASGSIAQVHRASLRFRYPGQRVKPIIVAVKVRHPGVGELIRRDFVIINLVAKISTHIPAIKWLRLDESVQQFAVFMMSQVDLAREAAHLSRFIYNFRRWKDVSFPKPLYPLVHPAVLVETYEQGECVSRYVDELEGHDRLKSALAHIGTHALLKMLLVIYSSYFESDLSNIIVVMP